MILKYLAQEQGLKDLRKVNNSNKKPLKPKYTFGTSRFCKKETEIGVL